MKHPLRRQGQTRSGRVTVVLQRGKTVVMFKQLPAEVCDNGAEYYLSDGIAGELLERAQEAEAIRNGAEVDLLRFAS